MAVVSHQPAGFTRWGFDEYFLFRRPRETIDPDGERNASGEVPSASYTKEMPVYIIALRIVLWNRAPAASYACVPVRPTVTWEMILRANINSSFVVFKRYSDFASRLSPSDAFVYLDENPLSLRMMDFSFMIESLNPNALSLNENHPAVNHGDSTSFSFADGHAELHQWRNVFLNVNINFERDSVSG